MGRKKIKIEKILDDKTRTITFQKRKLGIFKKAMELSVLTDCQIFVGVKSEEGKIHMFCSCDEKEDFYELERDCMECEEPEDFRTNIDMMDFVKDQEEKVKRRKSRKKKGSSSTKSPNYLPSSGRESKVDVDYTYEKPQTRRQTRSSRSKQRSSYYHEFRPKPIQQTTKYEQSSMIGFDLGGSTVPPEGNKTKKENEEENNRLKIAHITSEYEPKDLKTSTQKMDEYIPRIKQSEAKKLRPGEYIPSPKFPRMKGFSDEALQLKPLNVKNVSESEIKNSERAKIPSFNQTNNHSQRSKSRYLSSGERNGTYINQTVTRKIERIPQLNMERTKLGFHNLEMSLEKSKTGFTPQYQPNDDGMIKSPLLVQEFSSPMTHVSDFSQGGLSPILTPMGVQTPMGGLSPPLSGQQMMNVMRIYQPPNTE